MERYENCFFNRSYFTKKLLRIKQIEENDGITIVSEGIDSNYQDIANYAIFALTLFRNK